VIIELMFFVSSIRYFVPASSKETKSRALIRRLKIKSCRKNPEIRGYQVGYGTFEFCDWKHYIVNADFFSMLLLK